MFGAKDYESGNNQMSALLEKGCEFEGKLTFEGTVRINGNFRGEIFSDGTLVVGDEASVEGQLDIGSAIINGKVQGEIVAKDRIEMHRPAVVCANITSKTLVIEEGVVFEGTCRMGEGEITTAKLEKTTHQRAIDAVNAEESAEYHVEGSSIL